MDHAMVLKVNLPLRIRTSFKQPTDEREYKVWEVWGNLSNTTLIGYKAEHQLGNKFILLDPALVPIPRQSMTSLRALL